MKNYFKKTIYILFIFFICILYLSLSGNSYAENRIQNDFKTFAENKNLTLFLNEETTEIAVKNKENQKIWFSNPVDRQENEKILRGTAKEILSSQFVVRYNDPTGGNNRMNNFSDSIDYNQFEINKINNGIRIEYTLGLEWRDRDYLPRLISKEEFEDNILNKIEDSSDKNFVLENFTLIQLKEDEKEEIDISGLDKEKVFGNYRMEILSGEYLNQKEEISEINQKLKEYQDKLENISEEELSKDEINEEIEDLETELDGKKSSYNDDKRDLIWELIHLVVDNKDSLERVDQVKLKHINELNKPTYISREVPRYLRDEMIEIIKNTGYTPENVAQTHMNYNLTPPYPNIEIIKVPIDYILEGNSLIAKIPVDEIQYPENITDHSGDYGRPGEKITFPLSSIEFMPYFGAANNEEDGYIFVPDGSGALINLNNNKDQQAAPSYVKSVYGRDNIFPQTEKRNNSQQISFPVFGLKKSDKAFIGIIEEGDALANINANIAGRSSSYNTVFPSFTITNKGTTGLGIDAQAFGTLEAPHISTAGKMDVYAPRNNKGDIKIKYLFLEGKNADYVGMAKKYRDYLQQERNIKEFESSSNIPLLLELVGAIPRVEPFLGLPRETTRPLTSFSQAQEIIGDLIENGANNLNVKYSGWLKGGIVHNYPGNLSIENKLGEINEFEKFINFLERENVNLYPDVSLTNIHNTSFFDGFVPRIHSSRRPDRLIAKDYEFDNATYQKKDEYERYILSPNYLEETVSNFWDEYNSFGFDNLSLTYIGKQLNSDFRPEKENFVDRQQALNIYKDQVNKLTGHYNLNLMVNNGHEYLFDDISYILNIPLESDEHNIFDRSVPFYQIAVNGLINYAGQPFNYVSEPQKYKLKMLEIGALPYFKWFYEEPQIVKDTDLGKLFSAHYKQSFDKAINLYEEFNTIYKKIKNSKISDHKMVEENVFETTYSNGLSIIVNYNKNKVHFDNYSIPGEDYIIIEEDNNK